MTSSPTEALPLTSIGPKVAGCPGVARTTMATPRGPSPGSSSTITFAYGIPLLLEHVQRRGPRRIDAAAIAHVARREAEAALQRLLPALGQHLESLEAHRLDAHRLAFAHRHGEADVLLLLVEGHVHVGDAGVGIAALRVELTQALQVALELVRIERPASC